MSRRKVTQKISRRDIDSNEKLRVFLERYDSRVEIRSLIKTVDPDISDRAIDLIMDERKHNGLSKILVNKRVGKAKVLVVDVDEFAPWWEDHNRPATRRSSP